MAANTELSSLPSSNTLTGVELLPSLQSNNAVSMTPTQLAEFAADYLANEFNLENIVTSDQLTGAIENALSQIANEETAFEVFNADGQKVTFDLAAIPSSLGALDVTVGGVTQVPNIDYVWSGGTSITFNTPPPAGARVLIRNDKGLVIGLTAPGGVSNYRSTLAAGVTDFAVNETFSCDETGQLRIYQRIEEDPGYLDLGDSVAPLTKGLVEANTGAGLIGTSNGENLQTVIDSIGADISMKANTADVIEGLAEKANISDLESSDPGKGADLVSGAMKVVRATDYGLSIIKTPAANREALKLAKEACSPGDTLDIPPGDYPFDYTGTLADSVEIDIPLTISLRGNLIASAAGAIQPNPITMLNITADDVAITGNGRFVGNGDTNSENAGDDSTMPSLVRVTGKHFKVGRGIVFDTPYKIGLHVPSGEGAIIEGEFTGGPKDYTDTGHFFIRFGNTGRGHRVSSQFYPSADGGMAVQCVFSAGAGDITLDGCVADRPYEKLAYLTGDGHTVTNCTIRGNPDFIPGTNQKGTVGEVIRIAGRDATVTNNRGFNVGGGVTIRGSGAHVVKGNDFNKCGQSLVSIIAGPDPIDDTIVQGNSGTLGNLAGVMVTHGIFIKTGGGTNRRIKVSGNNLAGFAVTDPLINIATWQNNTIYPSVSIVKPTTPNGRYYTTHTGGTSGGSNPFSPDDLPDAQIMDGTITWVCHGYEATNAGITLDGSSGNIDAACVDGNATASGRYGLRAISVHGSLINGNAFGASEVGVIEVSSSTNSYRFNTTPSASSEKSGLSTSSSWVNYTSYTFEPVLSDGSNNASMGSSGSNLCRVTRIGDLVTVVGSVATTDIGSLSGAIRINGDFYPARPGLGGRGSMSVGRASGFSIEPGHIVTGWIDSGENFIRLEVWDSAGGPTPMQASEWGTGGNMAFVLTYHTA